jgi:hypothetical protein
MIVYGILATAKIVVSLVVSTIDPSDRLMILCRSEINVEN